MDLARELQNQLIHSLDTFQTKHKKCQFETEEWQYIYKV